MPTPGLALPLDGVPVESSPSFYKTALRALAGAPKAGAAHLLQIAMLAFVATTANQVCAQAFPDKNKVLRLVVPAGAGSATDILARAYGKRSPRFLN